MRSDRKFPVILGCVAAAVAFSLRCTPPPVLHNCPEPPWIRYSSFRADQVGKEAARLETLLAKGDTVPSGSIAASDSTDTAAAKRLPGLEIRRRLFELSIHHANPDYDLDKISNYALLLSRCGGPDSLRYLDWSRAANEQKALVRKRDSLATAITDILEGEKKEFRTVEKLKKEIRTYLQQIDSLAAVITVQKETIAKLQRLDVMMEQQRKKIK
jgi:hypothetical protein